MRSVLALLVVTACSRATPSTPKHVHAGTVEFETSCEPAVRGEFNDAVVLLHHMTYPQARAAFRNVAKRDPS